MIHRLVAEEIKKQLPKALNEAIAKGIQNSQLLEDKQVPKQQKMESEDIESDFRKSMMDMFEGDDLDDVSMIQQPTQLREQKTYTKDPKINAILNETTPFSNQQRTGMAGAAAAMAARYQSQPISSPPSISEGSEYGNSSPIVEQPMADMPDGVSVMDVKHHAPPEVKKALTRNYSEMMNLINKKKGKK